MPREEDDDYEKGTCEGSVSDTPTQLHLFGGEIMVLTEGYVNEGQLKAWGLSQREQEVTRCVCLGMDNPAIAKRLDIARRTVEVYLDRVYSKAGVTGRQELALLATRPPGNPGEHGLRLVS